MASSGGKEERTAEFIGIMLGDGSIGIYNFNQKNRKKTLHQLKVTLNSQNTGYIDYVSNLMKDIFDIDPKIFFKRDENAADIRIFKKEKVLYALNYLGLKLSPKWNKMEIPEKYSEGKLALSVLRGIFDTDGSVTIFKNNGIIYPRIEIRICPSPAQNQIINILKKNNFRFKVQSLDKGNIKIRISGEKELKNWFEKVGSSNPLYIERAKMFLEKKPL